MSEFMTGVAVGIVGTVVTGAVGYGVYSMCKSDNEKESGADAAATRKLEARVAALEAYRASQMAKEAAEKKAAEVEEEVEGVEPEAPSSPSTPPSTPAPAVAKPTTKTTNEPKPSALAQKVANVVKKNQPQPTAEVVEVIAVEQFDIDASTGKQYPKGKNKKGNRADQARAKQIAQQQAELADVEAQNLYQRINYARK